MGDDLFCTEIVLSCLHCELEENEMRSTVVSLHAAVRQLRSSSRRSKTKRRLGCQVSFTATCGYYSQIMSQVMTDEREILYPSLVVISGC